MANIQDHQYAEDARVDFNTGQVRINTDWGVTNLTINSQQRVFKAAKDGYVSNFALTSTDMDTNAIPTLTIDVGTEANDDAFMAAATSGQAGVSSIANVAERVLLAEGEYVIISIKAASATAAAGSTQLSFNFTVL